MQIHEITKSQFINEGLLDKVKNTISATKTKVATASNRWQEKQWDKAQDKRNKMASDAAKTLAKQGFNVDTTTSLTKAQTPTRVKQQQQQKVAQLQQAFDQEFDLKSGGSGPVATDLDQEGITVQIQQPGATAPTTYTKDKSGVWTDEIGQKITNPKSVAMLNAKADNPKGMQVNPAAVRPINPVKEGTLAQRAQARNAGISKTQVSPTGKKDIQKEFTSWISKHIPGIENVSPKIKQQLNQIYKTMIAAKGNPKAVDQAFQQYASIALNAVGQVPQSQGGKTAVSPSAKYAQGAIATQLGISPETISKLQQRIEQNKEQINTTNTGSQTIDKLIQAVTKK